MTKNRGETLVEPAYETYLLRIGRSGRFGRKGAAFNLIHSESKAETKFIGMIQNYFKCDMKELDYTVNSSLLHFRHLFSLLLFFDCNKD